MYSRFNEDVGDSQRKKKTIRICEGKKMGRKKKHQKKFRFRNESQMNDFKKWRFFCNWAVLLHLLTRKCFQFANHSTGGAE